MSTQIIRTGDGRALNSALLSTRSSDHGGRRQWQANQTVPDGLRTLPMTIPAWTGRTREAVLATTRRRLGDGLRIDLVLVLVEETPLAPNGMLRPTVPPPRQAPD